MIGHTDSWKTSLLALGTRRLYYAGATEADLIEIIRVDTLSRTGRCLADQEIKEYLEEILHLHGYQTRKNNNDRARSP